MAAVKLQNGQSGDLALNYVAEEQVTGVENRSEAVIEEGQTTQ
jgi:hypothetical protein